MTFKLSILVMVAIVWLQPTMIHGRLKSQWCHRYREVFMDMGCNGQKPGRHLLCSLLEVMFRQNNVGDPPCLFFPCTGWGLKYPRHCVSRSDCSADHIQALGMCNGRNDVCCRRESSG